LVDPDAGKTEAANRGGLNEVDADSVRRTPSYVAIPLYDFRLDQEGEIIGYAQRAFNFEASASWRHITNDAIDPCCEAKDD